MTELLFFKWDHSTQSDPPPSKAQLAALPRRFDLIEAKPDGWDWGTQELTNPVFRIIAWTSLAWPLPALAQKFLDAINATYDPVTHEPTSHHQYRAWFLALDNIAVPAALRTWWQDDTRAQPVFTTSIAPAVVINAIQGARDVVSFP